MKETWGPMVGDNLYPWDPGSPCQRMSKGCTITETKRKVFRFQDPILRFGEPGSLGIPHYDLCFTQSCHMPRPMTGNFGHFKVYAPPAEVTTRGHGIPVE